MNLTDALKVNLPGKRRKRIGRGRGSGHGKTSCRGSKGQRSRSGGKPRLQFEGGQTPLFRRLPKRGFTNIFKKHYALVNVGDLQRLPEDHEVVDVELLKAARLIKKLEDGLKVLGDGELTRALTVRAHKFSAQAKQKIEGAGGKVEVIG